MAPSVGPKNEVKENASMEGEVFRKKVEIAAEVLLVDKILWSAPFWILQISRASAASTFKSHAIRSMSQIISVTDLKKSTNAEVNVQLALPIRLINVSSN